MCVTEKMWSVVLRVNSVSSCQDLFMRWWAGWWRPWSTVKSQYLETSKGRHLIYFCFSKALFFFFSFAKLSITVSLFGRWSLPPQTLRSPVHHLLLQGILRPPLSFGKGFHLRPQAPCSLALWRDLLCQLCQRHHHNTFFWLWDWDQAREPVHF